MKQQEFHEDSVQFSRTKYKYYEAQGCLSIKIKKMKKRGINFQPQHLFLFCSYFYYFQPHFSYKIVLIKKKSVPSGFELRESYFLLGRFLGIKRSTNDKRFIYTYYYILFSFRI